MSQLTLEQAFGNLAKAASEFKGTLQEHQALQESLQVISAALKPAEQVAAEQVAAEHTGE